jgi:hypothetical protein
VGRHLRREPHREDLLDQLEDEAVVEFLEVWIEMCQTSQRRMLAAASSAVLTRLRNVLEDELRARMN